MQERFTLPVAQRTICGVLHLPDRQKPPFIIACHGLYSSKDSDKFTEIADRFTRGGLGVVRFDFGGCGESSGDIADTTASGRLRELEAVAGFARSHPDLGDSFGILGSSFGGFLALFYAARHPVRALSVWATPLRLSDIYHTIPEEDLQRLNKAFFTDAADYRLPELLATLHTVQIIHGEQDEVVPVRHAEEMFALTAGPKSLEIIAGADHAIRNTGDRAQAIRSSLAWFSRYLA